MLLNIFFITLYYCRILFSINQVNQGVSQLVNQGVSQLENQRNLNQEIKLADPLIFS